MMLRTRVLNYEVITREVSQMSLTWCDASQSWKWCMTRLTYVHISVASWYDWHIVVLSACVMRRIKTACLRAWCASLLDKSNSCMRRMNILILTQTSVHHPWFDSMMGLVSWRRWWNDGMINNHSWALSCALNAEVWCVYMLEERSPQESLC